MRCKCVLNKNNKNTNSDPRTQTHKLKKKKKKPRTQFQIQERKKKTPTNTHFLSFAQTHSKKQHPNLKCNNTNNTSLSLFSQKCHPNNSNRSQEPKSNPKATKQNTRSPSISTHLAMVELKQKILGITS